MLISADPKASLPHREPFLWVSRLIERSDDAQRGLVELDVPATLDVFKGHFPGNPIFPGVLQIEAAAQACLWVHKGLVEGKKDPVVGLFMGVDSFKFKKPVVPPAVLRIKVQCTQHRGALHKWEAELRVGEALVSKGAFWLHLDLR